MKKLSTFLAIALLAISFSACEKIPDGVVDNKFVDYKVSKLESPSSFFYSNPDSLFTASVTIQNIASVDQVWLSVKSVDGTSYVTKQVFLTKANATQTSTIFTTKVPMSKKVSSGKYLVEFFISDNIRVSPDNVSKVGEQVLIYNNNQTNYPPEILNPNLPSSIILVKDETVPVNITVSASDPNGLADIASVSYELYKPDGTKMVNSQGISVFPMFDDGNTSANGDVKDKDGIYTVRLAFPSTVPTGTWRFEFQAKDKSGAVSNVIKQTLGVN